MSHVTLTEAAGYLGVSKSTLRNWDKSGKLRAVRHPINGYRSYSLAQLQEIRNSLQFNFDSDALEDVPLTLDIRGARFLVARLHNILRDQDSLSNIIERFDELTKVLFLKLVIDASPSSDSRLEQMPGETDKDFASRIRSVYADVAKEHSNIVPSTFANLRMSDGAICQCANVLGQASFENVGIDLKGFAYEEVIKNTFDKNENQQFFTPSTIVRFIVEMMPGQLKGEICDPAAGTAGFLIEVLKSQLSVTSLTAFEIDERLAWVSGINLFTHGAPNAQVHWLPCAGTLGRDAERFRGKFDAIITNPPFGSDFTDRSVLPAYQLGRNRKSRRRGILFLERCHQLLKDGGSLGFIIDEGVLNLPSTEDVRRFITDNFKIEAIVSLPESAFMPYATVNASILFLTKSHANTQQNYQTFFAKAAKVGRKGNGDEDYVYDESGQVRMNSDLPEIASLYRSFQKTGAAPDSELAYATNVWANLRDSEDGWRLDFRYHHPARELSRKQLDKASGRLMSLSEICKERNETVIPSKELADQMILYTGLAHIESGTGIAHQVSTAANSLKSAVKQYQPGDIVFARMRPNLRKVALMDFKEGGYVSPECVVMTVDEQNGHPVIDPLLLSVLLRSELAYGQIMHLISGIGRPRLAVRHLRRVLIPSASFESQKEWRVQYLSQMSAVRVLRSKAEDLLTDASQLQREAVEQLAGEFA